MREILFRVQITDEEFEVKVGRIREILVADKKVKLTVMLRGRERARPEFALALLDRTLARLNDIARREGEAAHSGPAVSIIVVLSMACAS